MTYPSPRILVTRARAEPLGGLLAGHGLVPVHAPLVALRATGAPPPARLPTLVLVTSAATVRLAPHVAVLLSGARFVAVGPRTAASLRAVGIEPAWTGDAGGAAAVTQLRALSMVGDVLGYVGAARPSAPLDAALGGIVRWGVYDNIVPPDARQRLAVPFDGVTFASPSAARRYVALGGAVGVKVAVIGETTAAGARAAGLRVDAVAAEPSMAGLAAAAASMVSWQGYSPR